MAFWADNFADSEKTLEDPKRNFRFLVSFDAFNDQGGTLWMAKTAAKPSFAIAAAEHKFLNHTFFYPGSVTWQDVEIVLVDPSNPDMAATLSAIVTDAGYSGPSKIGTYTTISKQSAARAIGNVMVKQINATGTEIETWTLYNPWITDLKYGSLDYTSDDLSDITVTLKYDWARIETTTGSKTKERADRKKFFEGALASAEASAALASE